MSLSQQIRTNEFLHKFLQISLPFFELCVLIGTSYLVIELVEMLERQNKAHGRRNRGNRGLFFLYFIFIPSISSLANLKQSRMGRNISEFQHRPRRQQREHHLKTEFAFLTLCHVYSSSLKMSNVGEFPWRLISWGPHSSFEEKRKIHCRLFTSP